MTEWQTDWVTDRPGSREVIASQNTNIRQKYKYIRLIRLMSIKVSVYKIINL